MTTTTSPFVELAFSLERAAHRRGWDGDPELHWVCDRGSGLFTVPAPEFPPGNPADHLAVLAQALDNDPSLALRLDVPDGFVGLATVLESWAIGGEPHEMARAYGAEVGEDATEEDAKVAHAAARERAGGRRIIADLPGAYEVRSAVVTVVNPLGIPERTLVMRRRGEEPELIEDSAGGLSAEALSFIVGSLFAARRAA